MRFRTVILLTILAHIAFTSSRMTVSLYALKLEASPFTIGVLMSLYALLPMLLSVSAGRLIDRIGPRLPLLWGNGMLFAGVILPFIFPGLPTLFVAATLIGSGFMLVALAVSFWRRGDLVRHATPKQRPAGHSVMDLVRDRKLRSVLIVSGMLSMGWDLFTFVMPIHCAQIGLTATTTGIIMGAFGAATFVVRLGMPALSRRVREWHVITTAFVISGATYLMFPFVTNATLMMGLAFLLGLGLGCSQPMVMSLLYAASPA
ncbi:MAG: MFS transporter, partial [Proteobacteria bacterium]|nr:MFS transporter [Pseudomonadota bacterium]